MKWFRDLSITKKLVIGFLIVVLVAAGVGTFGIINMSQIKQSDSSLYNQNTLSLQYSGSAAVNFQQLRYDVLKLTTLTDTSDIEKFFSQHKKRKLKWRI